MARRLSVRRDVQRARDELDDCRVRCGWTEDSVALSYTNDYTLKVSTNRLLIANFAAAIIPTLRIESTADAILLTWPTHSIGFTLEQNTGLNAANWRKAQQPFSAVGSNYVVTMPPTIGNNFFRLTHP